MSEAKMFINGVEIAGVEQISLSGLTGQDLPFVDVPHQPEAFSVIGQFIAKDSFGESFSAQTAEPREFRIAVSKDASAPAAELQELEGIGVECEVEVLSEPVREESDTEVAYTFLGRLIPTSFVEGGR